MANIPIFSICVCIGLILPGVFSQSTPLPPVTQGCHARADVVFVLDGSNSVGSANFEKAKDYLKQVAVQLPVQRDGVHVGVVQYSGKSSMEFPLNMNTDRQTLMQQIDQIPYLGGGTRTGNGISYMREEMFSRNMGARDGVPRVGIVITDGTSTDVADTKTQADLARHDGIDMLALGVGSHVNQQELMDIAGGNSNHVYTTSSYDTIKDQVDSVLRGYCDATSTMPPPTAAPTKPSIETCVDKIPNCDDYVRAYVNIGGFCNMYKGQAQDQCPYTCGLCTTVVPVTAAPCVDEWANCTSYLLDSCWDPLYVGFFRAHCPMRCGLCDVTSQTGGFNGHCFYNGQQYSQGAKWYDGCDYECVCTDARHGKYECTNKCDVYYDLPADCTLVKKDGECCLQPVCSFKSNVPTSTVTQHTTFNGHDYCQYNGLRYSQNEYFEDGCNKKCTCTDASKGTMECSNYCPTYDMSGFPSYCSLQAIPGSCCSQPTCEFPTTVGTFTGHGTVTGTGVGKQYYDPSKQPPCLDLDPQCIFYDTTSCTDAGFMAYMIENCPVTCKACDVKFAKPTPGPNDKCLFDGKQYNTGETWEPDCAHQCTCDDQVYGYYRCSSKCTEYKNIPSGCSIQKLAGQCCPQVVCQNNQVIVPSTTNIHNQGGGSSVVVHGPNGNNTPLLPQVFPNGTFDPHNTGVHRPSINGCLYSGRLLVQGEAGMDNSCGPVCTCVDASTGTMKCSQRCAIYQNVDARCTMIKDVRDSCCQLPSCPPGVPTPVGVFNPPHAVVSRVEMPNLSGGSNPTQPPATTPIPARFTPGQVAPPTMPSISGVTPTHDCGEKPADIQFLLDVSGSLETANFLKQLQFVKNFARGLSVGPNAAQIGITTFSTVPHPQFNLNAYQNNVDLLNAIDKITYPFGDTRTDLGLDYIRQNSFTPSSGDRPNANNILIVVTDGQSTKPDLTKIAASNIHRENMDIYAIGVGDHVDNKELELIASDPSNVYTVTNYDSLDHLKSILHKDSCEGTCYFNQTGKNYKEGESWSYNCELNCLCLNGYSGKYICNPVCNTYTCPAGYQCTERPDPQYPCCKLLTVGAKVSTTAAPRPPTNFTPPCIPHSYQSPPTMPPTTGPKPTKDCGTRPADIHFLLDSSSSVGIVNFQKQLDFVKNFAKAFNIGPSGTQIGATIFSSSPSNQFWMNDHLDKPSLLSAIDYIPYPGGSTQTDAGLDYIRNNAFTPAHGDRPRANNILIVVTDGQSNTPALTKVAANKLHLENINIFAIGVGSDIHKDELELIASDPSNVYTVNNFDSLHNIQTTLQQTTCEGTCFFNKTGQNYKEGETWQDGTSDCLCTDGNAGTYECKSICKTFKCPAGFHCTEYPDPNFPYCNLLQVNQPAYPSNCPAGVTKNFRPGCEPASYNPPPTMHGATSAPVADCGSKPADIHFLLDSSGSVGAVNFQKQLDFVKQFASNFDIGSNKVRIGTTTFSTGVKNQFWMNTHSTKTDLENAITAIPYDQGSTHTDEGLDFVRQQAFTAAHGDRPGVSNILIVVTDGQSTDAAATKLAAEELHKGNIDVFAIGVGQGADKAELELIASDKNHVYTVDSFDALDNIQTALKQSSCEGSCHYNVTGKNYKTGDTWTQGCAENCICLDGNSGKYECKPVCKPFTCLPGFNCIESPDPHYPCCKTYKMIIPALPASCDGATTTPAPTPPPTAFPPGCQPHSYKPPRTILTFNNTNQNTDCGDNPADIHFLLDASGSVGAGGFQKQLAFVQNFASKFNISSNNVRIGVTTFDSTVHNQFWMNDHMNEQDLHAAIGKIPFTASGTRTDLGLAFVRQQAFTKAHGDRDGVNNILIVVTDGKSNKADLTKTEAAALHNGNLNVLSVGVGSGVNQQELELIASDPSNVYTVSSFDALSNIEDGLKKTTCEGSCHFNQTGKNYKEGEHWKYGCNLNCLCVDGSSGTYTCEDACQPLPRCPSGYHCSKYQDPSNQCCQLLRIDLPVISSKCPANVTHNFQYGCEPLSYVAPPTMPPGVTHKPITDCGSNPADIHFLIDASGSVGQTNFDKQLEFVKNFAKEFNVSSNAVRIGVTTFDSTTHQQFWMNEHMNENDLKAAIDKIQFTAGGTQTDLGLDFVRNQAFTKPHGARDNANNILIILTDGDSTDHDATKTAAAELHKENINVYSIGVGGGVNQDELKLMASDPANVFNVNNFDALHTIQVALKKSSCEGSCHYNGTGKNHKTGESWSQRCQENCICIDGSSNHYECRPVCKSLPSCPTGYTCTEYEDPHNSCCKLLRIELPVLPDDCPKPIPPVNPYTPGCEPETYIPPPVMAATSGPSTTANCKTGGKADIHFLLDSSGSVGQANYNKQLNFVKQFANSFTVGPNDVQIGVTTFSSLVHNQFWMNTHQDNQALISAIDKIPYDTGTTRTDLGIDFVREHAFTKAHGDRDGVNNILIVVTDGNADQEDKTKDAANLIHQENINIFSIGVGNGINTNELKLIASSPQNVYTVTNFDALHKIQDVLQKTACEGACFFNVTGRKYKEGERWQDGCNLNCLCVDGTTGHYICNDVCKAVPKCPAGFHCTEYPDPSYPCCKLLRIEKPSRPASCPAPAPTTAPNTWQKYTQGCQPISYVAPPTLAPGVTSKPITDCGANPADIFFLLDASGSVNQANFDKQLEFVKQFANSFNISSTAVRVGVATFSTQEQPQFWMNDHMDKPSLLSAITAIPYSQGNTHTELGLKFIRENAFTAAHGDRPGVNNILIVTTDGQSTQPTLTKAEADLIHKENMAIFVIGVGPNVDTKELAVIAGDPNNVYSVNNFDALTGIQAVLKKTTCEGTCFYNNTGKNYKTGETWTDGCSKNCICDDGNTGKIVCHDMCKKFSCPTGYNCTEYQDPDNHCCKLLKIEEPPHKTCAPEAPVVDFVPGREPPSFNPLPPWPPITGTRPPSNTTCSAPIDLLFLMDKSASIQPNQWVIEKQFVEQMVGRFNIGPNDVRVATSLFANFANHTKWCFNNFTTKAEVIQAVQHLNCPECFKGKTGTGHALEHARQEMLTPACGDRPGVPNIVVVITDGHSTEKPASYLKGQAAAMHKLPDTQVITVGVGKFGLSELQMIATDNDHVFTANNFNNLLPILDSVASKACDAGSQCVFNYTGKSYNEGDRWRYGCEYNCLCNDGRTGSYTCTDVCKRFSCPAGYTCTEYPDPDYPCCKLLKATPVRLDDPPIEYCTDSQGNTHPHGSTWVPTCAEKCVCVDASTNAITCTNRSDPTCP